MTGPREDTKRAIAAMKLIFNGRDPSTDYAAILVTLEHVVAGSLLATMGGDHRKAALMLIEALEPGVEARIAFSASKGATE